MADGIVYEEYDHPLPKKKLKKETLIKTNDLTTDKMSDRRKSAIFKAGT